MQLQCLYTSGCQTLGDCRLPETRTGDANGPHPTPHIQLLTPPPRMAIDPKWCCPAWSTAGSAARQIWKSWPTAAGACGKLVREHASRSCSPPAAGRLFRRVLTKASLPFGPPKIMPELLQELDSPKSDWHMAWLRAGSAHWAAPCHGSDYHIGYHALLGCLRSEVLMIPKAFFCGWGPSLYTLGKAGWSTDTHLGGAAHQSQPTKG